MITNLKENLAMFPVKSNIGIGHTRWATHGSPTKENAHPHISDNGKFALVHNGIIENAEELKKSFLDGKVDLVSQTDTEIVVQLMGLFYNGDVISAISETCKGLTGSFAFGILCQDTPDTLYAVGQSSPLLIVKSETGCFIASDFCAVGEEAEAVYHMRKALNGMRSEEALEQIINMFVRTKNNKEFVNTVRKVKILN